jgi:hypothetical protein
MRPATRPDLAATAGYSLIEMVVAMGLFTVVMGVTLSGLADVIKGNDLVMVISSINNSVRGGLDLMVRDLLQTGSGLPSSHTVTIPSGTGSVRVRLPGPPGTNFQTLASDLVLPAVMPRSGAGPTIDGIATDVLTVLMADNAFVDVRLTAVADSSVRVYAEPITGVPLLDSGPDRVVDGQLMMIKKGSLNTLVQVTNVNAGTRTLTFANGDSLRLNQSGAANGSLRALNLQGVVDDPLTGAVDEAAAQTTISRVRMITYYLDNQTDPSHPRLVRRINNGDALDWDNAKYGTAVAVDTVDLQFTYDISNGQTNPGGVEMSATDLAAGAGSACNPNACAKTQIRKVNLSFTAHASVAQGGGSGRLIRNTLESQVSLRAMAFVDRYR